MIKKYLFLITILSSLLLAGCATNAGINQMSVHAQTTKKPNNTTLIKNITVAEITGGRESNPLWTSQINNENFKAALVQSLQASNLYNELASSKYALSANLIKLKQPLVGFDMTVSCEVHYTLQNIKNKRSLYDKNIASTYTATISDAFIGVERLKMANEGAARENIKMLLADLYQLPKK